MQILKLSSIMTLMTLTLGWKLIVSSFMLFFSGIFGGVKAHAYIPTLTHGIALGSSYLWFSNAGLRTSNDPYAFFADPQNTLILIVCRGYKTYITFHQSIIL